MDEFKSFIIRVDTNSNGTEGRFSYIQIKVPRQYTHLTNFKSQTEKKNKSKLKLKLWTWIFFCERNENENYFPENFGQNVGKL